MTSRIPATRRGQQLLDFIRRYAADHGGLVPTYDEMAAAIGLRSKGRIAALLDQLEERGHLRRLGRRARAIELTGALAAPGVLDLPEHTQARILNLADRAGMSPAAFLDAVLTAHGDRP